MKKQIYTTRNLNGIIKNILDGVTPHNYHKFNNYGKYCKIIDAVKKDQGNYYIKYLDFEISRTTKIYQLSDFYKGFATTEYDEFKEFEFEGDENV